MSDNLVRDIHDAVANAADQAEASVRPPGTTARELASMQRDVIRKLAVHHGTSAVEIGCGIGLLGLPIARQARCYVGVDFAPRAVEVCEHRLRALLADDRAEVRCLDVLGLEDEELRSLGSFDRVLAYSVLHYARDERELERFLAVILGLLAPGGLALIGNIPLADLSVDWVPSAPLPRSLAARALSLTRWVMAKGKAPVPLTRRWKLQYVLESRLRRSNGSGSFSPARLPHGYTVTLTTAAIERVLAGSASVRWELPAPGSPLSAGRADLLLRSQG